MPGRGGNARASPARQPDAPLGREALVDELVAVAQRSVGGTGSIVLLTGEAGSGKTSVARAVARSASEETTVTWGTCTAAGRAPPFWPWRTAVDLDLAPPTAADGPRAPDAWPSFGRLDALRRRLARGGEPRLHVMEDVQWADAASMRLLVHVARTLDDLPMTVLATLRTDEPLDPPLAEAIAAVRAAAEVRTLPPLPDAAVDRLIRDAGVDPASAIGRRIRARSGANALFLTELLRGAANGASLDDPRARAAEDVPERVVRLVTERLARLPDALADLVEAAAVIGFEGDARTLATITATSLDSVVERLEQARVARLIETVAPGRWRFRLGLIRDAVYWGIADVERSRRHAAVLDVLSADRTLPIAVLANHALAAQPLLDAERAVALATAAGTSASEQHDHEQAAVWFGRALEVATPELTPRWRAKLLVLRGEALRQAGELDRARGAFSEAADLTDDPSLLARAALGYADPGAELGIAYRSDDATSAALLDRAIAAQGGEESVTTVLLESRLAAELYFSDEPARARRLSDASIDRAVRLGDPRALCVANAVAHDAFRVGQVPLADQLRGSQQLLDWALESRSSTALLTAHRARAFDLLAAADLPAMDAEILAFRRSAEPQPAGRHLWWLELWSAMRSLLEGRHDDAERQALSAARSGATSFASLAFTNFSFLLFFLRREQGRLRELEPATRAYASSHADIPAIRVALIFLLAELDRVDEASAMVDGLSGEDLLRLHDRNWPASWFQLARTAATIDHRDLAAFLLEPAHRPTERCVTVSLATVCLGATDLATAWLLHTVGDLDAASEHYTLATRTNARLGARSWLAQTWADHARLLLERDRADDRAEALRLTALASAAAEEIGLVSLRRALREVEQGAPAHQRTGRATASASTFRRTGSTWELCYAGRRAQVADARGLSDLAFLLSRPLQAVSVLELAWDHPAAAGDARGAPTLDERARRDIRARLHELDATVEEAEANSDIERAAEAREQRQVLAETVVRDLGLGGRARRLADPTERARKTVSTRIRRTIAVIGRAHPELGHHLERSIDTGTWCAYRPEEPMTWQT